MKKIVFLKIFAMLAVLFFLKNSEAISAFEFQEICQPVFKKFVNGNTATDYQSIDIEFPPGGGVTCHTAEPCPLVSLPAGVTVYSILADIVLTEPDKQIKTPYIWIPITDKNELKQVSTADCSVIETYSVISAPSRTYVIPGGDTWVASSTGTEISKLSPLKGGAPEGGSCGNVLCGRDENLYYCPEDCSGSSCGASRNEDCRKYEVVGNFSVASSGGIKGLTGTADMSGDTTGYVWSGNCGDGDIAYLDYNGTRLGGDIPTGGCPFGMVADYFNHIWVSNPASSSLQCLNISSRTLSTVDTINLPYGIETDDDSNIYVTCRECGAVSGYEAITGNCSGNIDPAEIYNTFVLIDPIRQAGLNGVAVDKKGYVWTANSHDDELYVFIDTDTWYNVHPGTKDLRGVAIDFDNYGWVVSYDAGIAYKYEFDDKKNMFNLKCQTPPLGGKSDSYSGMTGLRSDRKTIRTEGGLSDGGVFGEGTFEICAEETLNCSDPAPCSSITDLLASCIPDERGNCTIPLEVFSNQGGKYTLKNLKIMFGKMEPVTTGGIVPCGRKWNDPDTNWDDTKSCQPCHAILLAYLVINFIMKLVILIALLAMVIAGIIYAKTSGNANLLSIAKQNINKILWGFVIVFVAWIAINLLMILFGFSDPMGDDSWAIFNCNL